MWLWLATLTSRGMGVARLFLSGTVVERKCCVVPVSAIKMMGAEGPTGGVEDVALRHASGSGFGMLGSMLWVLAAVGSPRS